MAVTIYTPLGCHPRPCGVAWTGMYAPLLAMRHPRESGDPSVFLAFEDGMDSC